MRKLIWAFMLSSNSPSETERRHRTLCMTCACRYAADCIWSVYLMALFVMELQARRCRRPVHQVLPTRSVNINKTLSLLCQVAPRLSWQPCKCRLCTNSVQSHTGRPCSLPACGQVRPAGAKSGFRLSARWVIELGCAASGVLLVKKKLEWDLVVKKMLLVLCVGTHTPLLWLETLRGRCGVLWLKRMWLFFMALIMSEWWCVFPAFDRAGTCWYFTL